MTPSTRGSTHEVLEQMRADASSLPTVGDDERHLCVARSGDAVVPADTDDVVSDEREQRLTVVMVDMSEVHDLGACELRVEHEEPKPRRFVAEALVEPHEGIAVAR